MTKAEIRKQYASRRSITPAYKGKLRGNTAVLYSRFGCPETDLAYDAGEEMQLRRCRQIYSDLQIERAYIDCGNKTIMLEELLSDAEKGQFSMVIVKSISRLRRNIVEVLDIIKRLKSSGIAIYFETENLFAGDSDETQNLLLQILAEIAEEETRRKSESARKGWETRRLKAMAQMPEISDIPANGESFDRR